MQRAATLVVLRVMHSAHPTRLAFRLICLATFVRSEPPPPPPSSKPPPPAPPGSYYPLGVLRLVARGSMSDYPDTSDLERRISTAGGFWRGRPIVDVAISVATLDITDRVMITATLTLPLWRLRSSTREALASQVRRSLKRDIGTAASASSWLGITVESDRRHRHHVRRLGHKRR